MKDSYRVLFCITIIVMFLNGAINGQNTKRFSLCAPGILTHHTSMYVHTNAAISHANCMKTTYIPEITASIHECISTFTFLAVHKSILRGMQKDLFVFIPSDQYIPSDWYTCILQTINNLNVRLNAYVIHAST